MNKRKSLYKKYQDGIMDKENHYARNINHDILDLSK